MNNVAEDQLLQTGPRAHHFVAFISTLVGLSFMFEGYITLTDSFRVLDSSVITGQHLWGVFFFVTGILTLLNVGLIFRVVTLSLATMFWGIFAGISIWGTFFGPFASETGSFAGIFAVVTTAVCVLASANIRRDYKQPIRKKKHG